MNDARPESPGPVPGDMDPEEFRRHGYAVVDRIAAYLAHPERWPVLARVRPGELRDALPDEAPVDGESMEAILADYDRLILPATTHWNHPGFMAYFGITGSGPGILGEMLAASLNVNAMLWRTGPAATELEEVSLGWLRELLGLPAEFDGLIRLPTDADYRLDPAALEAAVAEDRARGIRPLAVVATAGTTSTTSFDPLPEIADLCARESMWLHVDAAYGGAAGAVPELRRLLEGWERADSIVVNPHKWLFVPIDCSALYTRRPDVLRDAFSLVPEYLRVPAGEAEARNLMDYGVALGRRFRALKLWFVLRYFGAEGMAERLRAHVALAHRFARWVDEAEDFERLAPAPLSVVVFRHRPAGVDDEAELDGYNERLLERVNATGEVFLSHTRAKGRYALRLAVGNLRTEETHLRRAWELLREHASR